MSYTGRSKADRQKQREAWRSWCGDHAELISASGIPSAAVADPAHWRDFLEISDLYPVDFDHHRLTLAQKVALLRLISTRPIDCSTPVALCLIKQLLDALEPRL